MFSYVVETSTNIQKTDRYSSKVRKMLPTFQTMIGKTLIVLLIPEETTGR